MSRDTDELDHALRDIVEGRPGSLRDHDPELAARLILNKFLDHGWERLFGHLAEVLERLPDPEPIRAELMGAWRMTWPKGSFDTRMIALAMRPVASDPDLLARLVEIVDGGRLDDPNRVTAAIQVLGAARGSRLALEALVARARRHRGHLLEPFPWRMHTWAALGKLGSPDGFSTLLLDLEAYAPPYADALVGPMVDVDALRALELMPRLLHLFDVPSRLTAALGGAPPEIAQGLRELLAEPAPPLSALAKLTHPHMAMRIAGLRELEPRPEHFLAFALVAELHEVLDRWCPARTFTDWVWDALLQTKEMVKLRRGAPDWRAAVRSRLVELPPQLLTPALREILERGAEAVAPAYPLQRARLSDGERVAADAAEQRLIGRRRDPGHAIVVPVADLFRSAQPEAFSGSKLEAPRPARRVRAARPLWARSRVVEIEEASASLQRSKRKAPRGRGLNSVERRFDTVLTFRAWLAPRDRLVAPERVTLILRDASGLRLDSSWATSYAGFLVAPALLELGPSFRTASVDAAATADVIVSWRESFRRRLARTSWPLPQGLEALDESLGLRVRLRCRPDGGEVRFAVDADEVGDAPVTPEEHQLARLGAPVSRLSSATEVAIGLRDGDGFLLQAARLTLGLPAAAEAVLELSPEARTLDLAAQGARTVLERVASFPLAKPAAKR